ncbi:MAG: monofunctional biosynthetic peptidoglycan transglycosylase [Candidatus Accumulibacter sp.]|jgi:monofunctional biosynthetic peptidoglycan transglycosylase|nr:monofunctional biosynthetic peptidoglycan transglycosylase [Accumulibacter sp.]
MTGALRAAAFVARWTRRLLLGLLCLVLVYHSWLFGWVVWWGRVDPDMTRFMEIRLAELQAGDPGARLEKQWIDYDGISTHLKRALIAAEDSLFTRHRGFDWNGIQNALEKNWQQGRTVSGGSTISQQLAKNLFLSPQKTPRRKAEEAVITLMIESVWSKRRIFEVYLNVIEWGNGVFGAEAAARHYFGIGAAQLTPEQAARLAAMAPRPRFFDDNRDAPELAAKAAIILSRMPSARIP